MATGGDFGLEPIRHFNGNLFDDRTVLDLAAADVKRIAAAASLDWSAVDPSIFGTLFERGLDPSKRKQLGAHYTSREDILLIVEPVLMAPLRRRWTEVQAEARALVARRDAADDEERDAAEAEGRPRDSVKILSMLTVITAPTDEEAQAKADEYRSYISLEGALALFGGWSGLDMSQFDPDTPLKYIETDALTSVLNMFTKADPDREWTPRDVAEFIGLPRTAG